MARFQHLDGLRCFASFWIVCAHYLPKSSSVDPESETRGSMSPLNNARYRVNVAVCFFVVVSGFVTHYSGASRKLANAVELFGFYLRRLGRVLFTFWIAMLWAVYLLERAGQHLPLDYVVKCVCLVEQWFKWSTPQTLLPQKKLDSTQLTQHINRIPSTNQLLKTGVQMVHRGSYLHCYPHGSCIL